tara:strand:- start:401 stop:1306 length:906 start_codon:yes stop_codon:yes gene_type:complete
LKQVEQVGFISNNKLTMMGNELCVNALLAFASIKNTDKKKTIIEIQLKYKKEKNIIIFKDIGFICLKKSRKINKKYLKKLSQKYNLPAFGAIIYKKNKITPYVYVEKVDSFVKETACGSGSIAFSLFSKYKNIIQPTGRIINIRIKKDKIIISAEVKEEKMNKINILFVCRYNRFRSRIAKAYFKKINKNKNIRVKGAGAIQGSYPLEKIEINIAKEFNLNINGKPQGLSTKLLKWLDIAVITADNVPIDLFKGTKKRGKKVIVWKIRDIIKLDDKSGMRKLVRQIIKKVDVLNKQLEKKK